MYMLNFVVTSKFSETISHLQATVDLVSQWMSSNLMSLNQSSVSSHWSSWLTSQISDRSLLMPSNAIIIPTSSARNLDVIFHSILSMFHHICPLCKSCFLSIHDLCRIRNTLDYTTVHTIATSLIHSKLD